MRPAFCLPTLVLLIAAATTACTDEQHAEILVRIRSQVPVTDLDLRIRNLQGDKDGYLRSLEGQDITSKPYELLLRPTATLSGELLFCVKGRKDGQIVAAAARIVVLDSKKKERVTADIVLDANFVDVDDDCYPACLRGEMCDCDDRNSLVNGFTEEICEDPADNNCKGWPYNDGCPCTEDEWCTGLPPSLRHLAGVGACFLGRLRCTNGMLESECIYGEPSVNEIPDNYIDDDCDGSVDEGSSCTPGAKRRCHHGFVDDPNHPDPDERLGATQRMKGECAKPPPGWPASDPNHHTQKCTLSGYWGLCEGDVLPQRAPAPGVGFVELALDTQTGQPSQCNGLDDDCDGLYDEERIFDADGDGYTTCGSTYTIGAPHTVEGVAEEFIDCADNDAAVHPGVAEVCGETVDQDCQCDHDPLGLPVGDPDSVIGKPRVRLDGSLRCEASLSYLDCGISPRSDISPVGLCSDGVEDGNPANPGGPYYRGYDDYGTSSRACYFCEAPFGRACGAASQACATKAEDCATCPDSGAPTHVAAVRPLCYQEVAGTCTGRHQPAWQRIVQADPYGDCGAVSCAGYYWGIEPALPPLDADECYEFRDLAASEVDCHGGPSCDGTMAQCCETAASLCTPPLGRKSQPVDRPLCQRVTGGCTGQDGPTHDVVGMRTDPYGDCAGSLDCCGAVCCFNQGVSCNANSECQSGHCECADATCSRRECSAVDCDCRYNDDGVGPCDGYLEDGRDDPDNTCGAQTCNGQGVCNLGNNAGSCALDYECESNNCECSNADCTQPRVCRSSPCVCGYNAGSGCIALAANTEDPEDCTSPSACFGLGSANCERANGQSCSVDSDCGSNNCECTDANCTEPRVCRSSPCVCGYNAGSGCVALAANTEDPEDCTNPNACFGLGSANCERANGQSCSVNSDCGSNHCECADATCSRRECSAVDCDCQYNDDGAGPCDGYLEDGRDDPDNSCGGETCNGQGTCNLANGTSGCAADYQCESNNCECSNADCTEPRVCRSSPCVCGYNAGSGCVALAANTEDPEDCTSPNACFGLGSANCERANGQSCSVDSDCGSNHCECGNAGCTTRVCSPQDCTGPTLGCWYADASGCDAGSIARGLDPNAACADQLACAGNGSCAPHCESNDDSLCEATGHCDVVAESNNDVCNPDHGADQSCERPEDCISNVCTSGSCVGP